MDVTHDQPTEVENRRILLVRRPQEEPGDDCFRLVREPVPSPAPGEALVRVRYLSIDPAQRIWMNPGGAYNVGIELGDVVRSLGVGEVVTSQSPDYQPGDLVSGMLGWQDFSVVDAGERRARPVPPGIPPIAALNVFGMNGMTAYFGLLDIGRPVAGETVVVSGAAGATGSLVGQIARIHGCRALGLAGTDEKCSWLEDELGFDEALNYRSPDLGDQLRRACPDGIDIYFDNVGGFILDLALSQLALGGRIVLCGAISAYNEPAFGPGPSQYRQLIRSRGRMEGFLVFDYADRYDEALEPLTAWVAEGRLRHVEDVVRGLERAPEALRRLFRGENLGKLLVEV